MSIKKVFLLLIFSQLTIIDNRYKYLHDPVSVPARGLALEAERGALHGGLHPHVSSCAGARDPAHGERDKRQRIGCDLIRV